MSMREAIQSIASRHSITYEENQTKNEPPKLRGGYNKPNPCFVDGVKYYSIGEACKAYGVKYSSVAISRFKSRKWPTWISNEHPKSLTTELSGVPARPVIWQDIEYKTIRQAAREHKRSTYWVRKRCDEQADNWMWAD